MNRLVIVGNGFDLAHGLPTRYEDFIRDYVVNAFHCFVDNGGYEDDVLHLIGNQNGNSPLQNKQFLEAIESDKSVLIRILNNNDFHDKSSIARIKQKNEFISALLKTSHEQWVDIEQFYYNTLIETAEKKNDPNLRKHRYQGDIKDLNFGFKFLKERFEHYLKKVMERNEVRTNEKIINCIRYGEAEAISDTDIDIEGIDSQDPDTIVLKSVKEIFFLNFNYTHTISDYIKEMKKDPYFNASISEIQIHGRVDESRNPIIFGFGDEMDDNYKLLERLNDNQYLDFMKSFGYFETNNYKRLEKVINSAPFEIFIMGHSCGLSDRVMLNTIFEHENCKSIKVFYYKDSKGSDNYTELTQNISRHFNSKSKMRSRMVSKIISEELTQLDLS